MISDFGIVILFIVTGALFVAAGLIAAAIVRPSRPNPIKNSTYECGEIPIGQPWVRFNNRFYVIALIFLLFDVEVVFLLPWAVAFDHFKILDLGVFVFLEMTVFVVILIAGLVYVWGKGDLDWERPRPVVPDITKLVKNKKEKVVL